MDEQLTVGNSDVSITTSISILTEDVILQLVSEQDGNSKLPLGLLPLPHGLR